MEEIILFSSSLWTFIMMRCRVNYVPFPQGRNFIAREGMISPSQVFNYWRWPNGRNRSNNKNVSVKLAHYWPYISSYDSLNPMMWTTLKLSIEMFMWKWYIIYHSHQNELPLNWRKKILWIEVSLNERILFRIRFCTLIHIIRQRVQ